MLRLIVMFAMIAVVHPAAGVVFKFSTVGAGQDWTVLYVTHGRLHGYLPSVPWPPVPTP